MIKTIILFDTEDSHQNLLPLSYTRSVADFRVGIFTIAEKWKKFLNTTVKYWPVEYLRDYYAERLIEDSEKNGSLLWINSSVLPDYGFVEQCVRLKDGNALLWKGEVIAFKGKMGLFEHVGNPEKFANVQEIEKVEKIEYLYEIFLKNGEQIKKDYLLKIKGRESQPLPPTCTLLGDLVSDDGAPNLFIEEGAELNCVIINVKEGPVYIGRNVQVMEGACLRGPLALCDNVKIAIGAKIYGETTFGPYCKVGGEVSNAVMFGYSNKAHDGYLGNAVIGEWCNIGAGVNCSNLKNNYAKIRLWNYATRSFMRTDLQFCGLLMGDHSKIGVNGMINTATVIGVGVNIHGGGFPRVFVPSFSDGSSLGFKNASMKEFHDVAERVMVRRGKLHDAASRAVFERIYEKAQEFKHGK